MDWSTNFLYENSSSCYDHSFITRLLPRYVYSQETLILFTCKNSQFLYCILFLYFVLDGFYLKKKILLLYLLSYKKLKGKIYIKNWLIYSNNIFFISCISMLLIFSNLLHYQLCSLLFYFMFVRKVSFFSLALVTQYIFVYL